MHSWRRIIARMPTCGSQENLLGLFEKFCCRLITRVSKTDTVLFCLSSARQRSTSNFWVTTTDRNHQWKVNYDTNNYSALSPSTIHRCDTFSQHEFTVSNKREPRRYPVTVPALWLGCRLSMAYVYDVQQIRSTAVIVEQLFLRF